MQTETLDEAREKMEPYSGRVFHNLITDAVFDFHTDGEDVADFYGDEEPDYKKYTNRIRETIS